MAYSVRASRGGVSLSADRSYAPGDQVSSRLEPTSYPVQCRAPDYYELCSERVRDCRLKKCQQLRKSAHLLFPRTALTLWATKCGAGFSFFLQQAMQAYLAHKKTHPPRTLQ